MKDCLKERIFSPKFTETLNEDYRFLHAHAETGFELHETAGYVRKRLEEIGLSPKACGRLDLRALPFGVAGICRIVAGEIRK